MVVMGVRALTSKGQILTSSRGHFKQILGQALNKQGLAPQPVVVEYLLQIFNHYMVADNFFSVCQNTGKRQLSTLAELWLKAGAAPASEQKQLLKRLGDSSLFLSGLFSACLRRKIVGQNYYTHMGQSAYQNLSQYTGDKWRPAYNELGGHFLSYADVLCVVSEETSIQGGADLLHMYEKFLLSNSKLAARKLNEHNIIPSPQIPLKKSG